MLCSLRWEARQRHVSHEKKTAYSMAHVWRNFAVESQPCRGERASGSSPVEHSHVRASTLRPHMTTYPAGGTETTTSQHRTPPRPWFSHFWVAGRRATHLYLLLRTAISSIMGCMISKLIAPVSATISSAFSRKTVAISMMSSSTFSPCRATNASSTRSLRWPFRAHESAL